MKAEKSEDSTELRGGHKANNKASPSDFEADPESTTQTDSAERLPQVLDFGRAICIPCKMMAPILEELQKEYRGGAVVEIIDIGDHPKLAAKYHIRLIPTQVFINADGKEVFRHEGSMPKEDIVAKLREMGVQ